MHMPPKMKLLIWKAYHNALPVNERLAARQIIPNLKCCSCDEAETIIHLFFLCPVAQEVWRRFPSKMEISFNNITSFAEGWRRVHRAVALPPTGVISENLAAWIIWSIWLARNQLIFREEKLATQEIVTKAVRLAREWTQAQAVVEQPKALKEISGIGSRCDMVCRSDAAWNSEKRCTGVAWEFLRNGNERVSSGSLTFTNVKSPLVAEGLALLSAMEDAVSWDFRQISFESDSSRLIKAVKEGSNVSDLHGILCDIYALSMAFDVVSFYWVRRNSVSHVDGIAKYVLRNLVLNLV